VSSWEYSAVVVTARLPKYQRKTDRQRQEG
jgi:hypothetical protein